MNDSFNIALGQRHVLQGRFLVTYRLVQSILIFHVSKPEANPFVCLKMVDAVAKILVGVSKGVDISSKRLTKKYSLLHSLIGKVLDDGTGSLPVAFIHSSATSQSLYSMPTSTSDAAKRLKRIAKGKTKKSTFLEENKEEIPVMGAADVESIENTLRKSGHGAKGIEFVIPVDALPPPPARVAGARRQPPQPPMGGKLLSHHGFEGAESQQQSEDGAEAEEEVQGEVKQSQAEGAATENHSDENEVQQSLQIPIGDLCNALMLVETWNASVTAGVLTSSDLTGEVRRLLAPYGLEQADFALMPSDENVVNTCLQTASMNKIHSLANRESQKGTFRANLSGSPIDTSYLKYTLPPSSCSPPIQVDFAVAPSSGSSNEVLVLLRYIVSPELFKSLIDVSITVDLPPELTKLVKVSHGAKWSPTESRLRWEFENLTAGSHDDLRLIMCSSKYLDDPGAVYEHIKAVLTFSGWPGTSFSGVGFRVGFCGEDVQHRGRIRTFGKIVMTP